MRRHDSALKAVALIGRASSARLDVRALITSLVLLLSLTGCYEWHDRHGGSTSRRRVDAQISLSDAGHYTPPDGGYTPPPDAGCVDSDNDGFNECVDCNDNNAAIHPGAPEYECGLDGVDSNCDGWDYNRECEMDPDCLPWLCNG